MAEARRQVNEHARTVERSRGYASSALKVQKEVKNEALAIEKKELVRKALAELEELRVQYHRLEQMHARFDRQHEHAKRRNERAFALGIRACT